MRQVTAVYAPLIQVYREKFLVSRCRLNRRSVQLMIENKLFLETKAAASSMHANRVPYFRINQFIWITISLKDSGYL